MEIPRFEVAPVAKPGPSAKVLIFIAALLGEKKGDAGAAPRHVATTSTQRPPTSSLCFVSTALRAWRSLSKTTKASPLGRPSWAATMATSAAPRRSKKSFTSSPETR